MFYALATQKFGEDIQDGAGCRRFPAQFGPLGIWLREQGVFLDIVVVVYAAWSWLWAFAAINETSRRDLYSYTNVDYV